MTIILAPEIERALNEHLPQLGTTPEGFVTEAVREKLASLPPKQMTDEEWIARLRALAVPAGVSLSDEAVSRESLYEDHL